MPCCGEGRKTPRPPDPAARGRSRPLDTARAAPPVRNETVYFEYVGKTGLTVFGPVTGRRYRFSGNGTVQPIDIHDAPSLARVPHLRRLSGNK